MRHVAEAGRALPASSPIGKSRSKNALRDWVELQDAGRGAKRVALNSTTIHVRSIYIIPLSSQIPSSTISYTTSHSLYYLPVRVSLRTDILSFSLSLSALSQFSVLLTLLGYICHACVLLTTTDRLLFSVHPLSLSTSTPWINTSQLLPPLALLKTNMWPSNTQLQRAAMPRYLRRPHLENESRHPSSSTSQAVR